MSKNAGYFYAFLLIVGMIIWTLITILGGAEILWWIFTGDFFHFVNDAVAAF